MQTASHHIFSKAKQRIIKIESEFAIDQFPQQEVSIIITERQYNRHHQISTGLGTDQCGSKSTKLHLLVLDRSSVLVGPVCTKDLQLDSQGSHTLRVPSNYFLRSIACAIST
jgi:hypothetical protein